MINHFLNLPKVIKIFCVNPKSRKIVFKNLQMEKENTYLNLPGHLKLLEKKLSDNIIMSVWFRQQSIWKEVSKGQVLLKIPFHNISVSDLKVESWQFYSSGNELHLRLERKEERCIVEKMLEEKRNNYDRFLAYPGERLK